MVSVMRTVETRHDDMVHDAQMDYYGTRLATCSSDLSIKIFDVRNEQQSLIADLKGHDGPVWQLSWSHPAHGNLLASCGYDKKVIIWKENSPGGSWGKIYEFTGHESSVNAVAWAPHEYGPMLACGSSDGHITILTGQPQGTWESCKISAHTIGVNTVSWAPAVLPVSSASATSLLGAGTNGSQVSRPGLVKRLASGGCDNVIRIWKFEDERWVEEAKLEGHSDWIRDVAWAPCLTSSRQMIASASQDCTVVIWVQENLPNLSSSKWEQLVLHTFSDVVWHVSWSITGNILAVSGGDNKVTLWKENLDGQWLCLSDVTQGQGNLDDGAD